MSKFFAYYAGQGGCDYTIGCNKKLIELPNVQTMAQAVEMVVNDNDDHALSRDRIKEYVSEIQVFEVADSRKLDVRALKQQWKQEEQEAENQQKHEAELQEFERLKAKLNK
jgi:hypothetical protein